MADQILPVGNFDKGGLVVDSDAFSLQPNEWSGGRNIRFDNRSVSKILGEQQFIELPNLSPVTVRNWVQPVNEYYIMTMSDGTTRRVGVSGTVENVTKGIGSTAEPLATVNATYTTSLFNGGYTYVVGDGVNTPQYIQSVGATSTELRDLPGWNYDTATHSSVIPKVIRAHRNVLVAANFTYTAASGGAITYAPGNVRVSDLAAPGAVPTWDPIAPGATTASDFELSDTDGVVDMVSLQNQLLIFTRNSIFALSLTGSTTIPVNVQKQLEGRGLLAVDCAKEFYGRLFVVGQEDIYVFAGGASVQSVADGKVRDYFFSNYNGNTVFVEHNSAQSEMWLHYSKGSSASANEILVWNYVHNTWTIRDANEVHCATYGSIIESGSFSNKQGLIMGKPEELLRADVGTSFSGGAINAYVERKGFDVAPTAVNFSKWTDSIYILATGTGTVDVAVRATDTPGRPVDFTGNDKYLKKREFTLSGGMSDFKVDPRTNGRYFNIRFGSNDATSSWDLVRYNLAFDAASEDRG